VINAVPKKRKRKPHPLKAVAVCSRWIVWGSGAVEFMGVKMRQI
jgi:hypothetical protein